MEILQGSFYGNTPLNWGVALGVASAIVAGVAVGKRLLIRHLGERARRTNTKIDDGLVAALEATQVWLIAALAVSVGAQGLKLPPAADHALASIATIALFAQVGLWLNALLVFWVGASRSRAMTSNAAAATSLAALGLLGQVLLWSLILLLALDNLGVNVTTLIAGLGIGGIAVALAVQNILSDLFASLSIVIDKPFVIGDFIIVDNYMGTVEHVGLKTTRIRSLDGEQIIFSNGDLLKTRLRNYKRMFERRIVFPFRLAYDTPPELLEQVPELVRKLVEGQKNTRFERAHFHRFGDASLDFETVFWMTTPDYNAYMDVQQAINLQLIREFLKRGVSFALPTSVALPSRRRAVEHDREPDDRAEAPRRRVIHQ